MFFTVTYIYLYIAQCFWLCCSVWSATQVVLLPLNYSTFNQWIYPFQIKKKKLSKLFSIMLNLFCSIYCPINIVNVNKWMTNLSVKKCSAILKDNWEKNFKTHSGMRSVANVNQHRWLDWKSTVSFSIVMDLNMHLRKNTLSPAHPGNDYS